MRNLFFALFAFSLLAFSGKVVAGECVSDFLMDGDYFCQRGLEQAYNNELKNVLRPVTSSGRAAVIGRCTCYGNEDIVSCTSSFTLNSCTSTEDGSTTQISFQPLIRGDSSSAWITNPSQPADIVVRDIEVHAGEGAAVNFLEAYRQTFDIQ